MDRLDNLRPRAQPLTLDTLASMQGASIVALGGERGFISRLAALGFVPGARIGMVQNYGSGPLIVEVHRARVALGRSEAHNVLVQCEMRS